MLECEKDEAASSTILSLLASEGAILVFDSRDCGGLDLAVRQGLEAEG